MLFDSYCISRDCLLNRTGDVTLEGKYITPFKDPNKRFGMSLTPLHRNLEQKYVVVYVTREITETNYLIIILFLL